MPTYSGADGADLYFDDSVDSFDDSVDSFDDSVDSSDDSSGNSVDGDPIVVLAGGAARHPDYLGNLDFLGTGVRRIVPHLRGVGRSPAASTEHGGSWWNQADDVEALRTHLGLERLTLVAHSAGTRIALAYAASYPDRIERLVLLTPPAHYLVDEPSDVEALAARRVGEPEFDRAMRLLAQAPYLSSDEAFTEWQQATAPAGYASWGPMEQAHSRVGGWNAAAVAAFFAGDAPTDIPQRIAALEAPVLVIAGADDCLTGLNPVVALAKLFPNGQSSVIADCGHYPWVERPMELTAIVTAFLERTSGPAEG
jgi:pimeloyl-ACP methyl ester carboxylesterase